MNWLILPPCNDTVTNYKVSKENGKNAQKTMRLKIQCGLSLLNCKIHLIQNFKYFMLCERSRWLDVGQVLFSYLRMAQGEVWVDKNAKKCGQYLAIFPKEAW